MLYLILHRIKKLIIKNKLMKQIKLIVILMVLCTIWSCQKDDDVFVNDSHHEISHNGKMMKLGKKLNNPYSVENMRKALKELNKNSVRTVGIDESLIQPTHLYIKFMPKNEEELDVLKSDSSLCLYDYPLDYEIEEHGDYYIDPEVAQGQPTYQYVAVKVGKKLPVGVDYEILSELYILEEDDSNEEAPKMRNTNINYIDWVSLEDKALEITGNLDESEEASELKDDNNSRGWFKKKWRPAGVVKVWDRPKQMYVGVEGVKVRARRWFTTHTGFTDASGYYSCDGRFRRKANYSIVWERYHFEIRRSWLGRAKYDGPKQKGDWNLYLDSNDQTFYATIFRAAHHYYYKYIKGLRRPPLNGWHKTQLKIRAFYEANDDVNGDYAAWRRFLGLGSAVKIYNPQRSSDKIYGTVIHELAHASHWNMSKSTFNNTETIVKESWARGVQWELTRMVYPNFKNTYSRLDYTGVVQDMIDGHKVTQSYYHSKYNIYSYKVYTDNVRGYSIRQLEDALKGQKRWNDWKNNIKNKYNNETENNLDFTFSYWCSK